MSLGDLEGLAILVSSTFSGCYNLTRASLRSEGRELVKIDIPYRLSFHGMLCCESLMMTGYDTDLQVKQNIIKSHFIGLSWPSLVSR